MCRPHKPLKIVFFTDVKGFIFYRHFVLLNYYMNNSYLKKLIKIVIIAELKKSMNKQPTIGTTKYGVCTNPY